MDERPLGDDRVTDQFPKLTEELLGSLDQAGAPRLAHKPVLVSCFHDGRVDISTMNPTAGQYLAYANSLGAIVLIPVREPSTDELHAQLPANIIGQMERFLDAVQVTDQLFRRQVNLRVQP